MAIEEKDYCMHLTFDSNLNYKLKECLPVTYSMRTDIISGETYINFIENKSEVIGYTFKPRYANEEDDKYISIDNIIRTSAHVVFSNSSNINLRYPLKKNTKYFFMMKINSLADIAGTGEYSSNLFKGVNAVNGINGKSTCTDINGVYTYKRVDNYIGNDIYPINVMSILLMKKFQLNHKYKLEITQTSGPKCKFGISFYDERGNELNTIAESESKDGTHTIDFDISFLGKDLDTETVFIHIASAESAAEAIEFSNINIVDNLGYFADQPFQIQYWSDKSNGYRELTKTEFQVGQIIKFTFTTPDDDALLPGAIRVINRNYISGTTDIDLLVTNFEEELDPESIVFINHIATNSEPIKFNLMETEIYKFQSIEIRYSENTRYIKMNRDTTKNPLGLTKVDYLYATPLIYAKDMFKACWTLTDVKFTGTTENITDMSDMFAECGSLTSIPETLNTSGSLTMDRMFDYCVKLTTIPELNTSNCTSMKAMFRGCRELTMIPLLDTTKVTNMREFLAYCQLLDTIPNLNTSSCTNLKRAFLGCKMMTVIPFLDTSHIESMEQICKDCELLASIGAWDTAHVKNFKEAFSGCQSLSTTPLLNTSSAVNMEAMFKVCTALYDFPNYNFTNVRNIKDMFNGCSNMVGSWDWNYEYIELIRDPYVVQVVEEVKLPAGQEIDAKIPVRDENGNIMVDADGKVMYQYDLDDNGNPKVDEQGNPIYLYERDEEGNIIKTNITYNVSFKAEYEESIEKKTGELNKCLNPSDWWDRWDEVPVYENGEPTGEMQRVPHYTSYENCFKDCDSIANSICVPDVWNAVYDIENSGIVYVYECTYITTGSTKETKIIHKFNKVETLEHMKALGLQIKKLFELKNFTTMVTARILYTYRLPYENMKEEDETEVAN